MPLIALIRSPSGIVVIESMLQAGLMLGTFSVLVRVTTLDNVGLWVLVNSLLGFSRAADFWSRGLASFVGEARGNNNNAEAVAFVSTAVVSGVIGYAILAVAGAGLIWLFAPQIASPSQAEIVRSILPLMSATFWLLAVTGTYAGAFLAFGRPLLKAAHTVGGALIFLLLALVFAPPFGLWGILLAQAVQAGLMLASSAITFHAGIARGTLCFWRRDYFDRLARFGSKATLVGLLQMSTEPIIRLLASEFGGLGSVAAVDLASRVVHVVRSLITALGQILVPEFARLGAQSGVSLRVFYQEVSRIFFVSSLSAFSLLASAAPAVEEIVLEKTNTGFVLFVWLLSAGWFANTVTSPAYFMLLGRRRLRPLFWSHAIMAGGTIVLGKVGGLLAGVSGAMAGAALAIATSAIWLAAAAGEGRGLVTFAVFLRREPARLLPVAAMFTAVALCEISGLMRGGLGMRIIGYVTTIAVTLAACLAFGDVRGLLHSAAKLK